MGLGTVSSFVEIPFNEGPTAVKLITMVTFFILGF